MLPCSYPAASQIISQQHCIDGILGAAWSAAVFAISSIFGQAAASIIGQMGNVLQKAFSVQSKEKRQIAGWDEQWMCSRCLLCRFNEICPKTGDVAFS
jgi:hypothetical protein